MLSRRLFLLCCCTFVAAAPGITAPPPKEFACDGSCATWFDGCNDCVCGPNAGEVGTCSFNAACSLDPALSTTPHCKLLKSDVKMVSEKKKVKKALGSGPADANGDASVDESQEIATVDGPPTPRPTLSPTPSPLDACGVVQLSEWRTQGGEKALGLFLIKKGVYRETKPVYQRLTDSGLDHRLTYLFYHVGYVHAIAHACARARRSRCALAKPPDLIAQPAIVAYPPAPPASTNHPLPAIPLPSGR